MDKDGYRDWLKDMGLNFKCLSKGRYIRYCERSKLDFENKLVDLQEQREMTTMPAMRVSGVFDTFVGTYGDFNLPLSVEIFEEFICQLLGRRREDDLGRFFSYESVARGKFISDLVITNEGQIEDKVITMTAT